MAVEVRIPTILRTYTDGEKAVEGAGATLGQLIDDLEAAHPGCGTGWSRTAACTASSTSTSTTRTSASSAGSTPRSMTVTP